MAGVTQIGNVLGYYVQDGERNPMEGRLIYRGIDVNDLVDGFDERGPLGFEETAHLLLFGALPAGAAGAFQGALSRPPGPANMFTEDMILKAPAPT